MTCNGDLRPVDKADVVDRIKPDTARYYDEFKECESCGQIYWKGSHYRRLLELVESVRGGKPGLSPT
jgi:uncharacterized protein with PIN domain